MTAIYVYLLGAIYFLWPKPGTALNLDDWLMGIFWPVVLSAIFLWVLACIGEAVLVELKYLILALGRKF